MARPRMPLGGRLLLMGALASGCGGGPDQPLPQPAPDVDSLAFDSAAEIQTEIEILDNEIADLSAILAQDASTPRPTAADPGALLEQARRARGEAEAALAADDLARASDSLIAASAHIEEVKRTLGLAEEWGF